MNSTCRRHRPEPLQPRHLAQRVGRPLRALRSHWLSRSRRPEAAGRTPSQSPLGGLAAEGTRRHAAITAIEHGLRPCGLTHSGVRRILPVALSDWRGAFWGQPPGPPPAGLSPSACWQPDPGPERPGPAQQPPGRERQREGAARRQRSLDRRVQCQRQRGHRQHDDDRLVQHLHRVHGFVKRRAPAVVVVQVAAGEAEQGVHYVAHRSGSRYRRPPGQPHRPAALCAPTAVGSDRCHLAMILRASPERKSRGARHGQGSPARRAEMGTPTGPRNLAGLWMLGPRWWACCRAG